MILGFMIFLLILTMVMFCMGEIHDTFIVLGIIFSVFTIIVFVYGCLHGFINYPRTEGTHQGVITAVDLEGIYFRRYEIYLKSSGYTEQSDETKYLIYDYESDLASQLQDCIGKKVKLHYGHDGGYIAWNSCGTYHIKSVELVVE